MKNTKKNKKWSSVKERISGVASGDYNEFRDQLYTVWFSVFARDKVAGSSGQRQNAFFPFIDCDGQCLFEQCRSS